ncbi:MAG: leucyl/phenylalanyl-tRNA--protein transferase [Myxococcales bacterium]|nr:leucyl/phenylalanyl-tRNA--protein transferase [Myxococcales bacterium]
MPVFRLDDALAFPRPEIAEPSGLLAVGGDLCTERLLLAYAMGIFPWYSEGEPILWFSPPERMVLPLSNLHINRSLRKALRKKPYRLTMDTAFADVVQACAVAPRPDQDGTWITEDMKAAYLQLFEEGFAHSVEAWEGDELVGGLYGVSLGAAFFGESMFSKRPNASKIAFAVLVAQLRRWNFSFVDCQIWTPLFESLGAEEIPRRNFLQALDRALITPSRPGRWSWSGGTPPDPETDK